MSAELPTPPPISISPFDPDSVEQFNELLRRLGACDRVSWAKRHSLRSALEKCREPELMRWFVGRWRPDLAPSLEGHGVAAIRKMLPSAEEMAATIAVSVEGPQATAGVCGTATAGDGGTLLLTWWDEAAQRRRTVVGYVGEAGIKPGKRYRLDDAHQLVLAEASS